MRSPAMAWVPRLLWVIAFGFAVAWLVSSLLPRSPSSDALKYFDPAYLEKSRERANLSYITSGLASFAAFAALYLFSRSSPVSGRFSGPLTGWGAAKMGLALGACASILFSLVSLPFSVYAGHVLERRFGLSRMSFGAWFLDYLKSSAMDLLAYAVGAAFLAWVLVRIPRGWYLVTTAVFLTVSVIMSALYPLVIAPLFNKFHPLEEGAILEDVRSLSEAAGMQVDRVLVMEASAKTARVNAYFAGVGRTREVVLYDTLLTSHTPAEVRLVVAHELGHWHYSHVVQGILVSALGTFVSLFLFHVSHVAKGAHGSICDFRSLESILMSLLVFIVLFSYVVTPISSFVSRSFEEKSDAYSILLTGDRDSFIASQVGLAKGNLSDVQPPSFIRWFAWTHPTTLERLRMGEQP